MRSNCTSAFAKLGRRADINIAVVSAAVSIEWSSEKTARSVQISVGSASKIPVRLQELEGKLTGSDIISSLNTVTDGEMKVLSPISDIRASAQYRRHAAAVLVQRALRQTAEDYANGHMFKQHH
jgi:CO/xanthine dehydrogenase FAD-binding subunit